MAGVSGPPCTSSAGLQANSSYPRTAPKLPLPAELIAHIAALVDRCTLAKLALASRSCQVEAERVLYRDLRLAAVNTESQWRALKIMNALSSSPRRAQYVLSLDLDVSTYQHRASPGFQDALCEILPLMTQINHLSLDIYPEQLNVEFLLSTLRKCTFHLLTFRTSRRLQLIEWAFQHHPFLKFICLHRLIPLCKEDLRLIRTLNLSTLHGGQVVLYGLSACSQRLYVFPCFAPVVNGLTTWSATPIRRRLNSRCFRGITAVVSSLCDGPNISKILESIAENFATCRILILYVGDGNIRVNDSSRHTIRMTLTTVTKHPEGFLAALRSFSSLVNLEVRFWNHASYLREGEEDLHRLATVWALSCPSLCHARFALYTVALL